ncbi:MAG: D-alanyl-D-alanine carboxypeptidase/D-alanyl-D-alanine-endopeptidase [Bacteroidota bacterium]
MKNLIIFFTLATLLYGYPLNAQINLNSGVSKAIEVVADDPALKHASFGVCVIDVEANEVVAAHNPDISLIPASSLKTVTTATALAILGSDFQFKTEIAYDGTLSSDGVLDGNLYIKGYGDPTLGSSEMVGYPGMNEVFRIFVEAIRQKGIKKITGLVVGDGTHFETAVSAPTWQWNDIGNYYGAGASGLNINENLYRLNFQLSSTLDKGPKVSSVDPEIPYLIFVNELGSAGKYSGDNAYIFGAPYTYTRHIRGTLPIGNREFTIKGSIPDPAYFVASTLVTKLEAVGISTSKFSTTQRELIREGNASNTKRIVIHTHKSPPLWQIVERANRESVNVYCETLLKEMGKKQLGEGSTAAGLQAVQTFWEGRGLNWDGFVMKDGSGLSPRNTVTARHLAGLLRKVAKDQGIYSYFYESLPIAGQNGTLKNMLKGTAAEGKLRAKSGSMSRVRSYSGYVRTKSGKMLSFSIIANHFLGKSSLMRKKMETIMAALAEMP